MCDAIYRGYPYISYIKNDADLNNLFKAENGFYLKSIEEIYNAGMKNTLAGKGYSFYFGDTVYEYHFINNKNVLIQYRSMYWNLLWMTAEYEIKNYTVIYKNIEYHNKTPDWWKTNFILYTKEFENIKFFWEYNYSATVDVILLKSYNDMKKEL